MKLLELYLINEGNYLTAYEKALENYNYFYSALKKIKGFLMNEYDKSDGSLETFMLPQSLGHGFMNLNDDEVGITIISNEKYALNYECNPHSEDFEFDWEEEDINMIIKALPFDFIYNLENNFHHYKNYFIHEYKHYIQYQQGYHFDKNIKNKNKQYSPDENYKKYINQHSEVDAYILDEFSVFLEKYNSDPIIQHYYNKSKITVDELKSLKPKSVLKSKQNMINTMFKSYYNLGEYTKNNRKKIIKKLSVLYDDFMNKIIKK